MKITKSKVLSYLLLPLLLAGCASSDLYRVGSYNIRCDADWSIKADGINCWDQRKAGFVGHLKSLDLDVFGLQEVTPGQARYIRENLPGFEFVGEHRDADRKSGEASPVCYRKSRFEALDSGTFWLSETPDTPGLKGWGAACPRVCSYLILRDRESGKKFCFANTHTDHVSAKAREQGMLLVIERMKKFGAGAPIVFTGDHNCRHADPPAVAVRKILDDARDVAETPDPGPSNTFQGFGKYKDGPSDATGKAIVNDLRIDYIYVTPGTRVRDFITHGDKRGEGLYYSDHYPVTATIEFVQ